MALTRANVEVVLINRCGPKMIAAGMDGTTIAGSNADINDPIATTLLSMGVTPANIASVADADLASITDYNQLLDRSELRLLENIAGNLDMVDITAGPVKEALSQLHDQVTKSIQRLETKITKLYGAYLGTLTAGVLCLDFQEDEDA